MASLSDAKAYIINALARIEDVEYVAKKNKGKINMKQFRLQLMTITERLNDASSIVWGVALDTHDATKEQKKLLGATLD